MDEKKHPRKYFQNSENHLFNMVRKQEKTGLGFWSCFFES